MTDTVARDVTHPEMVKRFIQDSGGILEAHKQALEFRNCYDPSEEWYQQWQDVATEIRRQAKEIL